MITFAAANVAAANLVDDVRTLVLAERDDGSGLRLEIQGGAYDEQDESLGMDTYCLCTESGATHYGRIVRWHVDETGGVMTIHLDDRACRTLDVSGGFQIQLPSGYATMVRASMLEIMEVSQRKKPEHVR